MGRIHFPGSRQYGQAGTIENADEVADAPEGDVVKVIGTKEAVAKAAESLQVSRLTIGHDAVLTADVH